MDAYANYVASGNIYTAQELMDFVQESPQNAVSFAINRNPDAVYAFIQQNFTGEFQRIAPGMAKTQPVMNTMFDFLARKLDRLADDGKRHLADNLIKSLPMAPQLLNWTLPKK